MPEETGDAEVDEFNMTITGEHDIAGFHIAEDNGGILAMQIFEHVSELTRPAKDTAFREWSTVALKEFFERRAINKFHDHKVALILREEAGNGWQIGVIETPKDFGFDFEILDSLCALLGGSHRQDRKSVV